MEKMKVTFTQGDELTVPGRPLAKYVGPSEMEGKIFVQFARSEVTEEIPLEGVTRYVREARGHG
ncbi:hypothetical protein K2X83_01605 [Patescibacteria group bacterium]|nr:hypothetical protein [Patescibacteria group bacterium]